MGITKDKIQWLDTSGNIDSYSLPDMSAGEKGAVPATSTPSGKFLKDDATWATPAGSGGKESHITFVSLGVAQSI